MITQIKRFYVHLTNTHFDYICEGMLAYTKGMTVNDNPYALNRGESAWREGWERAHRDNTKTTGVGLMPEPTIGSVVVYYPTTFDLEVNQENLRMRSSCGTEDPKNVIQFAAVVIDVRTSDTSLTKVSLKITDHHGKDHIRYNVPFCAPIKYDCYATWPGRVAAFDGAQVVDQR